MKGKPAPGPDLSDGAASRQPRWSSAATSSLDREAARTRSGSSTASSTRRRRMIDTADVYSAWVPGHSGGESESLIGEWLKSRRGRARCDRDQGRHARRRGRQEARAGADRRRGETRSLKRSGRDDRPLLCPPGRCRHAARGDARRLPTPSPRGKVRALGASNYSGERLGEALAVSAREGPRPL